MNPSRLPRTPVLPPIISSSDKTFLVSLQSYIDYETKKLESSGQLDAEQQCTIYGNVFDKVIDYCSDYKTILTAIKREYDEFIARIKQGQREAAHRQRNLKVLACEPTTLMYYMKRASELTDRIEIIKNDSQRIANELQKIQEKRRPKTLQLEKVPPKAKIKPSTLIPGMTVEESLSMDSLIKYQQHLEARVRELRDDIKYKYVPMEKKHELDEKLKLSLYEREEAEAINKKMLISYRRRRVIADTISSWAKSNKSTSLNQTLTHVIAKENEIKDDIVLPNVFDDFDPRKITEAESLLEYVERFNELFVSGDYKAAAIFAANSPRGILRNLDTMERFRAVRTNKELYSPLMLFFEAVIGSSVIKKYTVNAALTLEGIKCALSCNRLDDVIHWVNQQRLTFSEALGDVISDYGEKKPYHRVTCLALAQLIYRKCSSFRKAALSMCLQGQVQGALNYTYECKQFLLDDYLFLLKHCATPELIHGLTKEWNGKPAALSVGQAVLSLLCTDHKDYGFQLLESVHRCGDSALEQVILNDVVCTPEGWVEIADECLSNNYRTLSEKIISIVTSQDGVVEISSKDEDAKIMEHIFM
ncbi:clathrin heavy chain linker domain-containing protein 1 [Bombina bombina]|uniref:clathrin heavy chain linker domain-containing protein 1 n=1 Tax=Bombina bombina TaxID=8345 RepID=UPI00235AD22B|nr:clathrin heavy chain linker domain-containing protein 1 [Bombina bombina]